GVAVGLRPGVVGEALAVPVADVAHAAVVGAPARIALGLDEAGGVELLAVEDDAVGDPGLAALGGARGAAPAVLPVAELGGRGLGRRRLGGRRGGAAVGVALGVGVAVGVALGVGVALALARAGGPLGGALLLVAVGDRVAGAAHRL